MLTGLLILCCAFAGLLPVMHARADDEGPQNQDIIVREKAGLTRTAYPVTITLPTATGTVPLKWRLTDSTGTEIPCSCQRIATNAFLVSFVADLPAHSARTFRFSAGADPTTPGTTRLPLFMGTTFLAYVEKTLEVASYAGENQVRLMHADGTPIETRTLGADESFSYAAPSPQVIQVNATKPVSVWLVTMSPRSQQEALAQSNDDVYGAAGADLLVRTFGQLWLAAPSSATVTLSGRGTTRTVKLSPPSVHCVDDLEPGIYRLKSPVPVTLTSGVEEDNVSCVQYPVGLWFAGPSFGQTTMTSWQAGSKAVVSSSSVAHACVLPDIGSSMAWDTVAQQTFAAGKSEWEPFVVSGTAPFMLTSDGNSGNFGLEQYPSTTLAGAGQEYVVTSGKIFSGFSTGHFRRLAVIGVQNGTNATLTTGTVSRQISLAAGQAVIVRINDGFCPVHLISSHPVELFDLGEETREGLGAVLALSDSSVEVSLSRTSSLIPAASAATGEPVQTPSSPDASPSSGQPLRTAWSWIVPAVRSVGTFFSSLYAKVRDFFVLGQALQLLETVTQAINDFAVRVFLPLAAALIPLLQRIMPSFSSTPALTAIWIFRVVAILILVILLILLLRPRHAARKHLPKVSPRTASQSENSIEFGLAERGPVPMPARLPEKPLQAQSDTTSSEPPMTPSEPPSTAGQQLPSARPGSPSVPEISLEPLGFFGDTEAAPEPSSTPAPAEQIPPVSGTLPPLELENPSAESAAPPTAPESSSTSVAPLLAEPSSDTLLEPLQTEPMAPTAEPPVSEPELTPVEQAPASEEAAAESPAEPLSQSQPIEEPGVTEQTVPVQESQESSEPAPVLTTPEEQTVSAETEPAAGAKEDQNAASRAEVLAHLLEEKSAFQPSGPAKQMDISQPDSAQQPAPQPSVFAGDIDLDALLHEGIVTDAAALAQLFSGGYRNRISKLAISAKDLQNVPEEIRSVVKLTVVALSPIELSIARDLAMRLEAPGYVGEALLVSKKMGYETYLTTYKNISKNYKDVSIVETTSLKAPEASSIDSGGGLISFS